MQAIDASDKKGPKAIYSSFFLKIKFLIINTNIEKMAAIKNANNEICAILLAPKNKPKAPMNFTSPSPIALSLETITIIRKGILTANIPIT